MDDFLSSQPNYEILDKPIACLLPKRLKWMRCYHDFKQREIADIMHLNRSTYAYYETGKTEPSLGTLMRLARFYSVSVDFLLGMDRAA